LWAVFSPTHISGTSLLTADAALNRQSSPSIMSVVPGFPGEREDAWAQLAQGLRRGSVESESASLTKPSGVPHQRTSLSRSSSISSIPSTDESVIYEWSPRAKADRSPSPQTMSPVWAPTACWQTSDYGAWPMLPPQHGALVLPECCGIVGAYPAFVPELWAVSSTPVAAPFADAHAQRRRQATCVDGAACSGGGDGEAAVSPREGARPHSVRVAATAPSCAHSGEPAAAVACDIGDAAASSGSESSALVVSADVGTLAAPPPSVDELRALQRRLAEAVVGSSRPTKRGAGHTRQCSDGSLCTTTVSDGEEVNVQRSSASLRPTCSSNSICTMVSSSELHEELEDGYLSGTEIGPIFEEEDAPTMDKELTLRLKSPRRKHYIVSSTRLPCT